MQLEFIESMINDPEMQDLFHSKNSYDLIIVELHRLSEAFLAFGSIFNAPVISVASRRMDINHEWILGNSDLFHSPNPVLDVTEKMSLVSRAVNIGWNIFTTLYFEFYSLRRQQMLLDQYIRFEKRNVPTLKEMLMNISVSFVNNHHSLGYVEPCLPHIVNVAGIHFTPSKPLPNDLQNFMDEAKFGVIYLSLGSLIEPKTFQNLGKLLISVVEALPQRIIMKWNRESLPHVPSNVLVREWLPQSDILSTLFTKRFFVYSFHKTASTDHPHCRLFITHGGYLSLLESLNASVPVLGAPFVADQPYNMAMVEYFELGNKIELNKMTSDLKGKINETLNNPKYKENMQQRSIIFQNRLASPMDTAMYWIDHVLQHKDTSHLKSASMRLKWYELYSVDVLGVLMILVLAISCTLKFIFSRFIFVLVKLFAIIQTRLNIKSEKEVKKTV